LYELLTLGFVKSTCGYVKKQSENPFFILNNPITRIIK